MSRTGSARMLASFPASLASSGPIGFALPDPASLHSTFGRMYASLYCCTDTTRQASHPRQTVSRSEPDALVLKRPARPLLRFRMPSIGSPMLDFARSPLATLCQLARPLSLALARSLA